MDKDVYISGPMSGIEDYNIIAFSNASKKIKDYGDIPYNPHDIGKCAEQHPGFKDMTEQEKWEIYMRYDIAEMMLCDLVVLLPGWSYSRGAVIEKNLADIVGIPSVYIDRYPF
jgi:hypothetical protein